MYANKTWSATIDLNGDNTQIIAQGTTHVGIKVQQIKALNGEIDVYIKRANLLNIIFEATNSYNYCRLEYWKTKDKCTGSDILSRLINALGALDEDTNNSNSMPNTSMCSVCDYLYNQFEHDFLFSNESGLINMISPQASTQNSSKLKSRLCWLEKQCIQQLTYQYLYWIHRTFANNVLCHVSSEQHFYLETHSHKNTFCATKA